MTAAKKTNPPRPDFTRFIQTCDDQSATHRTGKTFALACQAFITHLETQLAARPADPMQHAGEDDVGGDKPVGDATPGQVPSNFLTEEQLLSVFAEFNKRWLENNWSNNPPLPAASAALFRDIAAQLFQSKPAATHDAGAGTQSNEQVAQDALINNPHPVGSAENPGKL